MFFLCDATIQFRSLEYHSVHRFTYGSSMVLQILRPYGAEDVIRCSCIVVRCP